MKDYLWVLLLAAGLMFTSVSKALVYDDELSNICTAKANIAGYAMLNRDEKSLSEMIAVLDHDWEEYKQAPGFEHHVYVDLTRVIYDAYRLRADGGWRRPADTDEEVAEFVNGEVRKCARQGF